VSSVVISMIGRLSHNLELLLLGGAGSENALPELAKPPLSWYGYQTDGSALC
jgi:hypothetical protein